MVFGGNKDAPGNLSLLGRTGKDGSHFRAGGRSKAPSGELGRVGSVTRMCMSGDCSGHKETHFWHSEMSPGPVACQPVGAKKETGLARS